MQGDPELGSAGLKKDEGKKVKVGSYIVILEEMEKKCYVRR